MEKDITSFIQERGTGQEIPDPPKYINFCRGDVNDSASETSEDDNYSVAQFQRTINPAFRSSSPQPSTYESHHDPQSDLAKRMGHTDLNTPPSREVTTTPQKMAQQHPPPFDYTRQAQAQAQAQFQQPQQFDLQPVPHNEYPTDGMTMFCRTDAVSERSSVNSPVRRSSRDSQSDYSNPTSLSSVEPTSGKASPTKHDRGVIAQPVSPAKQVQKRRSGFFSNSPFRRKSKHEKDGPDEQKPGSMGPPTTRSTWGPSNGRIIGSNNSSPIRPGTQVRDFVNAGSHSPEPVDPRANFQLNVGPNVFDVASPDRKTQTKSLAPLQDELDPIAQALEELKGVTKQSSVRMSADRYHGIATPAPPGTPGKPGTPISKLNNGVIAAAQRGTPPPSYDPQPVKRLDLPQPAFTSAQMQQTTRKYVGQNQDMYGSASRPGTRNGGGAGDIPPRATSPLPMRSVSPRPAMANTNHAPNYNRSTSPRPSNNQAPSYNRSTSPRPNTNQAPSYNRSTSPRPGLATTNQTSSYNRSVSPNPYGGRPRQAQGAGQSQSVGNSPVKQNYGRPNSSMNQYSSRQTSPNDVRRAASPKPQFSRQPQQHERPSSSAGMALQLSNGDPGAIVYGSSQRGRNLAGENSVARPMTYHGGGSDPGRGLAEQNRSKSIVDGRQYNRDGRPILHFGEFFLRRPFPSLPSLFYSITYVLQYIISSHLTSHPVHSARAMYVYQAAIPEELSFAKGDVLAVLRLQDDGWWEAEVTGPGGNKGRPGLVPSNYLQTL